MAGICSAHIGVEYGCGQCSSGCTHHYIFNTPDGSPTVTGICKRCGAIQVCPVYPDVLDKLRTSVVDKGSAKW